MSTSDLDAPASPSGSPFQSPAATSTAIPGANTDELHAEIARLKIRGEAYENAYRVAYQATFQSHNGHWDSTMRGGLGCPECIRAREARENCDAALREGLEKLAQRAARAIVTREGGDAAAAPSPKAIERGPQDAPKGME